MKNAEGMISRRNRIVWLCLVFKVDPPVKKVAPDLSFLARRAPHLKDGPASLTLILSSLSATVNRFQTGACLRLLFKLRGGLRINTAFFI